jgi:hypothetical protein
LTARQFSRAVFSLYARFQSHSSKAHPQTQSWRQKISPGDQIGAPSQAAKQVESEIRRGLV